MLNPASWLEQAQRLQVGERKRMGHDCGPGECLIVENKSDGWSAYCHRCSPDYGNGWIPKPKPSLHERLALLAGVTHADDAARLRPTLPRPQEHSTQAWPLFAKVWLYKAGLSNADIAKLGIYWCPAMQRVVLPVTEKGQVIYWQARGFDEDRPKYINPQVDRRRIVSQHGSGSTLVLTEDILSAWKVGRHTEAWSIMGTKLQDLALSRIVGQGRPVLVWLDPDWNAPPLKRAGPRAMSKIVAQLRQYGVDAKRIISRADPKLLTPEEIHEHLYTKE
jgi:hypothetical protein